MISLTRKNSYIFFGLLALALALVATVFQLQDRLVPKDIEFVWLTATGTVLLSLIAYQWYLMRKRWMGTMVARDLLVHQWIGVFASLLFALHAARIGHSWMVGLTIVFFLTALTGVLNKQVIPFRARWMYLVWLSLHISFSVILAPLIAVHIWVALAYQ